MIEKYYEAPRDIEFVVDLKRKIIYLVQARPIRVVKTKIKPSYVTSLKDLTYFKGQAIVIADGTVRHITDPKQLLTDSNLQQALGVYNNTLSQDSKKLVKSVVSREWSGSMSHPATEFRRENKTCLSIDDFENLQSLLKKKDIKLLIDIQRGVVIDVSGVKDAKALIKEGWLNHPISQKESLIDWNQIEPWNYNEQPYIETSAQKLLTQVVMSKRLSLTDDQLKKELSAVKEAKELEAQQALIKIMRYLFWKHHAKEREYCGIELENKKKRKREDSKNLIFEKNKKRKKDIGSDDVMDEIFEESKKLKTISFEKKQLVKEIDQYAQLFKKSLTIAQEILPVLQLPSRSLKRLYVVNALETLLFQKKTPVVIKSNSYLETSKEQKTRTEFFKKILLH